jgi:hypothetical protein
MIGVEKRMMPWVGQGILWFQTEPVQGAEEEA